MSHNDSTLELLIKMVTDANKSLDDIQKLEFVNLLELQYCIESTIAMLEVVKQALKLKDCKPNMQQSLEQSLTFLLEYIEGAKLVRGHLSEISGNNGLKNVLKGDSRLEEKIVVYIKAIPIYIGGLDIVKKSEAHIKTMVKKALDFIKKNKDGNPTSGGSQTSVKDDTNFNIQEDGGEKYTEKELKFFVSDLMNYLQVLKIQSEEKGVNRRSNVDELKKFKEASMKMKLIGFYGDRVNDMKEGTGQYYYLNGDTYDGEWKRDKKHGHGTYMFFNKGNKYEGSWREDKMNGRGIYYYADGSKYNGDWVNDKRDGNGTFYFENATRYEGEWKDDEMHGKGMLIYHNGSKYMGEWKNGQINGRGVFQFANGYQIEEDWRDGIKKKEHIRLY